MKNLKANFRKIAFIVLCLSLLAFSCSIQDSVAEIVTIPKNFQQEDTAAGRIWVNDLAKVFYKCYQKGVLPSEAGVPWARCGRLIDLTQYRYFPGGIIPKNKGNQKNEIT